MGGVLDSDPTGGAPPTALPLQLPAEHREGSGGGAWRPGLQAGWTLGEMLERIGVHEPGALGS